MRRLIRFLLTISLLAGTRTFVHAQTAAYAEIVRIDAENFPKVSVLVDVYDANGEFIRGLEPSNITVYEDAQENKADSISESALPVQVVVAVNPGPPLAIRDSNAVPRFERVVDTLHQWADSGEFGRRSESGLIIGIAHQSCKRK
jgi:hypothetical protein